MFKANKLPFGIQTPNVEISEGTRVAKLYVAASYLPLVRYDHKLDDYVVISYGKVVARDNNGFIVLAGLSKDVEVALSSSTSYNTKAEFITGTAAFANVYSSVDVANGVLNAQGDAVTLNEPVVASFFGNYDSTNTQLTFVSAPLGIAPQNIIKQNGAGYFNGYQAGSSANFTNNNWSLQHGVTILTRYFIELPVVANLTNIALPGLAVFEGTPSNNGLVTFTANSNFTSFNPLAASAYVSYTPNTVTDAELTVEFNRIISWANKAANESLGRIYFINDQYPQGFLQWVRTYDAGITSTPKYNIPSGSATDGLPHNLYSAGETTAATAKTVRINLLVQ